MAQSTPKKTPPAYVNVGFGMIAACTSTALVHPLDVARVRAQVGGSGRSWMRALVVSAREKGIRVKMDNMVFERKTS